MADLNGLMSMAPEDQNAMGIQALMSGKVKPEEVQKAQALIAHPAFSMAGADAPTNPAAAAFAGQAPVAPPPRKQTKTENKNVSEAKQTTTQNTYSAPDAYAERMKAIEDAPFVRDEQNSIQKSQDQLNMQAGQMPQNDNTAWIRPLAALTDSTTGSKLSAQADALPSTADRMAKIATAQDALSKRKNDLGKLILEGGKQLKDGTTVNLVGNTGTKDFTNTVGDQMGGAGSLSNVRGQALIKSIGDGYDNDKVLTHLVNVNNSLDRAKTMVSSPGLLTSKNLNAAYMDYINSLSTATGATEGKISREIPENLLQTMAGINAYVDPTGKNADIRSTPEGQKLIKNFLTQIGQVQGDYKKQGVDRATQKLSTFGQLTYPGAKETADAKVDWWKNQFQDAGGGQPQAPPPGGDVKVMNDKGEAHIIHAGPKQQADIAEAAAAGFKAAQ